MAYEKNLCVIHANCQGEPLVELLALSPAFSSVWEVRHYTNYIREEIPQADLDRCSLFFYQHLGPEWGEASSGSLAARLNPAAEAICMPNMFFKGYWPFWTSTSPIDFGDTLLDKLIDSGAHKPEIIKIYCYGDVGKFADLENVAKESLAVEEEKDKRSPIKMAPLMRELWRDEPIFYTCNHPAKRLLASMTNQLLGLLGLPELSEAAVAAYQPEYSNFELPIHPHIAAKLRLSFIGAEHKFNIFGRGLSFLQYVSRYIDCRQQGYDEDFIGYLQLV